MTTFFTSDALKFLSQLAKNNDKAWFDANKSRYEKSVRDPLVAFLAALSPKLQKIAPHYVVDARPQGGSLSRIYRDTRFSKDKSPYKTGLFAHITHDGAGEGAAPGLYFRFEPKRVAVGAGIWRPEAPALARIRKAIDDDGKRWEKVTKAKTLGAGCSMVGESLKRPPPGYAPDHPHVEDLKRKDFALSVKLDDAAVTSPKFLDDVVAAYKGVMPFASFIAEAVGLDP